MPYYRAHIYRSIVAVLSICSGIIFLIVLDAALPTGWWSKLLLDKDASALGSHPYSVQNLMWLVCFLGIGELGYSFVRATRERGELAQNYLPEDEETILLKEDLKKIFKKIPRRNRIFFLPRIIRRVILHFNVSSSVDQANSLLNNSLELFLHEIDLKYTFSRYILWLIPTLGFIGTVIGIANAMEFAGDPANKANPDLLYQVTGRLGVAFFTTLLALAMSGVLVFFQNIVQAMEEGALNASGNYCLDNLINRLYEE